MEDTREFGLGDVLSITTGRLVSPRGIQAVYDVLDFVFGGSFMTHELPVVGEAAKPLILEQHPQLAACDHSWVTRDNWEGWLEEQEEIFGKTVMLRPCEDDRTDELHVKGTNFLVEHLGTDHKDEEVRSC